MSKESPEVSSATFLAFFALKFTKVMKKDFNEIQKLMTSQHTQKSGMAYYDDTNYFLFAPDEPVVGSMPRFHRLGIAQQLNDGSFEFVPKPQLKTQSLLIKKLAHGRVSKTKDGAIQLTLKVYCDEGVNISETIAAEAEIARDAIVEYQLKR